MKSSRLNSTTERYSTTSVERAHGVAEPEVLRVEAVEAIEGDRQRSLRQELRAADPASGGVVADSGQARSEAREIAARLVDLPEESRERLTKPLLPSGFCVVDEKA